MKLWMPINLSAIFLQNADGHTQPQHLICLQAYLNLVT